MFQRTDLCGAPVAHQLTCPLVVPKGFQCWPHSHPPCPAHQQHSDPPALPPAAQAKAEQTHAQWAAEAQRMRHHSEALLKMLEHRGSECAADYLEQMPMPERSELIERTYGLVITDGKDSSPFGLGARDLAEQAAQLVDDHGLAERTAFDYFNHKVRVRDYWAWGDAAQEHLLVALAEQRSGPADIWPAWDVLAAGPGEDEERLLCQENESGHWRAPSALDAVALVVGCLPEHLERAQEASVVPNHEEPNCTLTAATDSTGCLVLTENRAQDDGSHLVLRYRAVPSGSTR